MEFYMQKARLFAMETAKKSQEIATQAAKLSQELATETAKRSKELAIGVSKKADQLKTYAGDQLKTPSLAVPRGPGGTPPPPSDEELEEYGITQGLREFVKGLTIKTFRDFPIDGPDGGFRPETGSEQTGDQIGKQDLNPWRERHAVLVLLSVKEISDFRYVLCPRRMNETRFWRIYFTLVKNQIAGSANFQADKKRCDVLDNRILKKYSAVYVLACPYSSSEARALEKEVARAREAVGELDIRDLRPPPPYLGEEDLQIKEGSDSISAIKKADDLDAYFLGALDSGDEGIDGDDDDGFDADFDQLVNSAVDSDVEDEASRTESSRDSKKAGQSVPSSSPKPLAASEVSSDGELVEIPDSESEQTSRLSVAEKRLKQ